MIDIEEKKKELRKIYLKCLEDSEALDSLKAGILLQELNNYDVLNFEFQYKYGRYFCEEEQISPLVYEIARTGLVDLFNKGNEEFVIAITQKGEEALKNNLVSKFV